MTVEILTGDCREILPLMPEKSVHCCVTSPPYWGLRDYGVDGQIGLESSPAEFISEMVKVFREVRRVLRDDGTLWLNLGDTYAGARGQSSRGGAPSASSTLAGNGHRGGGPKLGGLSTVSRRRDNAVIPRSDLAVPGLKPKDLIGIPWRVALALQADGWYLRCDIIWHKPNPMPESCKDRPTKAHEYVFLLSKSEKYYYDHDAIKEPVTGTAHARRGYKSPDGWDTSTGDGGHGSFHKAGREKGKISGVGPKAAAAGFGVKSNPQYSAAIVDLVNSRNKRSVWTVPTQPYSAAHFATFPEKLIEPCIKAGCPRGGVVLDIFGGSGTTGRVATRHRRNAVLIELNPNYVKLQHERTSMVQLCAF
ncbi:MAG: site-specific DNA-methyltransferase [Desulfurivibrionaceae bacterium]|jgi:site-specific DNA-methyltransferase (cytosine-N4-specific)